MKKFYNRFITVEDLKNKINDKEYTLCLFGVSENGKIVLDSFEYEKIKVDYIVDNDLKRIGTELCGVTIISPDMLQMLDNSIVIITSSYYADIYDQLELLNIENVFELIDIKALCSREMLEQDEKIKKEYMESRDRDDIFVYVADGFGDNIIKYPILERLSNESWSDHYYFLVDRQSNYDIYSLLFKNVFIYDSKRFYYDRTYRDEVLRKINSHYFKIGMCFCATAYYHNHHDPFGKYNTNIPEFKSFFQVMNWENGKNYQFVVNDMEHMAKTFFGYDIELNKKTDFMNVLKDVKTIKLPRKFVAFGMGGISWKHVYSINNIVKVLNWLCNGGYYCILLGYGEEDDSYYENLIKICDNSEMVINLSSKNNAFESMKVIQGASAYVGLDSALAHAACALDINTVVLMSGNLFSRKFMHVNEKNVVYLNHKLECDGCDQCIYGAYNNRENDRGLCIQKIDAEIIIDVLKKWL